jgi:hypothetical protein
MTDTVGQDKLLSEAASSRLKNMGERTVDFTKGIFKSIAWYEWTDPIRRRTIEKPVKGTDVTVRGVWSKETRQGDFLDYNFDIDVFSMQDDSPSTKLQKIGTALERFVFPIMPMLEAQGGRIDLQELVDLIGRLGNVPELSDIVTFQSPEVSGQQPQGDPRPAAMPANTTRTYERVNRPGGSRSGKDTAMMQLLMGGKGSPAAGAMPGKVG